MSENELLNLFKQQGCFPHQAEFAARFFAPGSARKHLLLGAVGFGKTVAASAVVSHAFVSGHATRILVLCPPALVAQWRHAILNRDPEVPVLAVDRRAFRELDAGRPDAVSPWPASAVVVMSIDLAKHADMLSSLTAVTWDLLVVDEVQYAAAASNRYRVINDLLSQSPDIRVLLLRAAAPQDASEGDTTTEPLLSGTTVTVWSRATIKDNDGNPLLPEVQIEWITHRRKPDEVAVLSRLQELLQAMASANSATQLVATALMQSASSSLFSLEQRLNRIRQLRNEFAHGVVPSLTTKEDLEDATVGVFLNPGEQAEMNLEANQIASQILPMLDRVESDSKLEVLLEVLEKQLKTGGDHRVCIFTRYVDTARYLETALREQDSRVASLFGALSFPEREQVLQEFDHNGGILIVTEAMPSTIPQVSSVIFYDIPLNPAVIDARIGQFVRVGRKGPIRVFAFADESNALVIERLQRKIAEIKNALGEQEIQDALFSKDKT